jgi:hypothetical protein
VATVLVPLSELVALDTPALKTLLALALTAIQQAFLPFRQMAVVDRYLAKATPAVPVVALPVHLRAATDRQAAQTAQMEHLRAKATAVLVRACNSLVGRQPHLHLVVFMGEAQEATTILSPLAQQTLVLVVAVVVAQVGLVAMVAPVLLLFVTHLDRLCRILQS